MIQDYMLPLNEQFDDGFGAIAGGFSDAAKSLDPEGDNKGFGIAGTKLPYYYLKRHAIELYLKGSLIILHRRFSGEYQNDRKTLPLVSDGNKSKKIFQVHDLKVLFNQLVSLTAKYSDQIKKLQTMTDWTEIPDDLKLWIDQINDADSRSTMFRYPISGDGKLDAQKSSFKKRNPSDVQQLMADETGDKMFLMAMKNEDGEITSTYVHDSDPFADLSKLMDDCILMLSGTHIGMMFEMVYGKKL